MLQLIRSWKAMTTTRCPTTTLLTATATAPAQMDHKPMNPVDPVAFVISFGLTLIFNLFASKKNSQGPCQQLKMAKVTRVTNDHIIIGYDQRHRAAPTAKQHSALATTLGTSFGPLALCGGSLGRRWQTR
ncbi:hypothetical protein D8674_036833 [Pyrus ussuriensis x Pyrus communis]|uniref:Uncharacterized protein n=1 Tax=Pyrus ussuriensis x Pyrus communis TaxID=2448454 RepID=A0A5N5GA64_9ROSA|nr:hypothetical protein D8674_036833 [Pyrus ussuriensis x Pyrus communis]